ncbi:MAG TPA: HAD family phosphatase [Saprospiraceae bacterium]|nr:HAD family phosphatase [Saprospiraceae bacterium]
MNSSKARNLLFDFGNVLIDLDVDGAFEKLQKLFRSDVDKKVIDKAIIDYECGRISTDIFINSLLSQCHGRAQALDIIEAWNSMLVGIPGYRLEMLRMLRQNYNVYLLSNTNALHLEWIHRYVKRVHKVSHFEKEFFHQAYYSHLVGDRKPLPSIFKFIIDDSFMTPALTLYMDDIQENLDVAEKLGFQTHLVQPGKDIAEYLKLEGYY